MSENDNDENQKQVAGDDTLSPDEKLQKNRVEEDSDDVLNSTMMGINVGDLNLDATRTSILNQDQRADENTDKTEPDVIEQQLQEKKSPIVLFFKQIFARKERDHGSAQVPKVLSPVVGVWICEAGRSILFQMGFYLYRLMILASFVFAEWILFRNLIDAFQDGHPRQFEFLILIVIQALLSLWALWRRWAPSWLFVLPHVVLALLMMWAAMSYHTADRSFFSVFDHPISQVLTEYYLTVFTIFLFGSFLHLSKTILGKIWFSLTCGLGVVFLLLVWSIEPRLEWSLFGSGFLSQIPIDFLQPTYLVLHGLVPLLVLTYFIYLLLPGRRFANVSSKSYAGGYFLMSLTLLFLSLSLLQSNRVDHALNLVFPQRLDVGGIEIVHNRQSAIFQTKNFKLKSGSDQIARYKFKVQYSKKRKKVLLEISDAFDRPVRNLRKADVQLLVSGRELRAFEFEEDRELNPDKASYWVGFKAEAQEDLITLPKKKRNLESREVVSLQLNDAQKVARLTVSEDELVYFEKQKPIGQTVDLPLVYFEEGSHNLTIKAYDDLDQEIYQNSFRVSVKNSNRFEVVSPINKDQVLNQLPVVLTTHGLKESEVVATEFYYNTELLSQFDHYVQIHTLDLNRFQNGVGILKVVLKTAKGEYEREVFLSKTNQVANLEILEPSLGQYTKRQVGVKYKVAGDEKQAGVIDVYVNGQPFKDFVVSEQGFELPIYRWQTPEIYLTLVAHLPGGGQVSRWVQINRGVSGLDLDFDLKTLNFLGLKKVNVVLDASVSNWDVWQNRLKWDAMTQALMAPEIEDKISALDPSFFVMGSTRPNYYKDCDDIADVLDDREYSKPMFKRLLEKIKPKGVSAIVQGVKKAYRDRPDLVLLFADSTDSCTPRLSSELKQTLRKSPNTKLIVVSLGSIAKSDQVYLQRLAEETGGRYIQPENYNKLIDMLLEELALSYELYFENDLIYSGPLGKKSFSLSPGHYTLKIPDGTLVHEVPLRLNHSMKKILKVYGKTKSGNDKIYIDEDAQKM